MPFPLSATLYDRSPTPQDIIDAKASGVVFVSCIRPERRRIPIRASPIGGLDDTLAAMSELGYLFCYVMPAVVSMSSSASCVSGHRVTRNHGAPFEAWVVLEHIATRKAAGGWPMALKTWPYDYAIISWSIVIICLPGDRRICIAYPS